MVLPYDLMDDSRCDGILHEVVNSSDRFDSETKNYVNGIMYASGLGVDRADYDEAYDFLIHSNTGTHLAESYSALGMLKKPHVEESDHEDIFKQLVSVVMDLAGIEDAMKNEKELSILLERLSQIVPGNSVLDKMVSTELLALLEDQTYDVREKITDEIYSCFFDKQPHRQFYFNALTDDSGTSDSVSRKNSNDKESRCNDPGSRGLVHVSDEGSLSRPSATDWLAHNDPRVTSLVPLGLQTSLQDRFVFITIYPSWSGDALLQLSDHYVAKLDSASRYDYMKKEESIAMTSVEYLLAGKVSRNGW